MLQGQGDQYLSANEKRQKRRAVQKLNNSVRIIDCHKLGKMVHMLTRSSV